MKFSTCLVAVIAAALAVEASHVPVGLSARHHHNPLARRDTKVRKTCKSHKVTPAPVNNSSDGQRKGGDDNDDDGNDDNSEGSGLIQVNSKSCGPSGATRAITKTTGPNGSLDWLTCGIHDKGGWRPPMIRVQDIVSADLRSAYNQPGSPFKQCSKFIGLFEEFGDQFGLPPILLASFAMQESSCNPATVGGGGEQGLMQITQEKCGGAPGGDCKNPRFNIKTAASYFSKTLKASGGNLLLAIGTYNGWHEHLTFGQATAARYSSCCRCQNNLDYPFQFLNGWMQGHNAYDAKNPLGRYFNLNVC